MEPGGWFKAPTIIVELSVSPLNSAYFALGIFWLCN